jgi:hypothetical protein
MSGGTGGHSTCHINAWRFGLLEELTHLKPKHTKNKTYPDTEDAGNYLCCSTHIPGMIGDGSGFYQHIVNVSVRHLSS